METVQATVAGDIRIFGLRPKCIERLRYALSIPNPEYEQRKIFKLSVKDIPDCFYCLTEYPDGSVTVPRGSIQTIKRALQKDNVTLKFTDLRVLGEVIEVIGEPQLRPYQGHALSAMTIGLQGCVVMPCGSGKTRLGVAVIGRLRRKAIVFVHTEDLLKQWVEDVRNYLHLEPGTIRDGELTDGPVVIAMVRTTINLLRQQDPDMLNSFGICLIDEAHRTPSETYQIILPSIRAKYRFGLTATPDREDGRGRLMDWSCGERLYEIGTKELSKLGFLMLPTLEIVETEFEFNSPTVNKLRRLDELQKAIVKDQKRNELIVRHVATAVQDGEFVVVLSNNREHCLLLGRMLWENKIETSVLISQGKTKKAQQHREQTIQGMRDGKVHVIVATSLLDEGISIDRLSCVVLALPQKAQSGTQQRSGRSTRVLEGKHPKIIDIVDRRVDSLVRRFNSRMQVYREMGIK